MKEFIDKLIERLEELKQIERDCPDSCGEEGYGDCEEIYDDGRSQGRYEQAARIISIVKELAAEYLPDNNVGDIGWIPVEERLPESSASVLVYTDRGEMYCDYYGAISKDFIGLKGTGERAIAWFPIPKPYQPKGERE